jgi:RimJ/RimL family protein N-acetyltransferase
MERKRVPSAVLFVLSLSLEKDPGDRAVGAIACRPRDEGVDFGFVLDRDAHGRGLATEASCALVGWLKSQPRVGREEATGDVENAASARVPEKAGLVCERLLPAYGADPNLGPSPGDAFLHARVRGPSPVRQGRP